MAGKRKRIFTPKRKTKRSQLEQNDEYPQKKVEPSPRKRNTWNGDRTHIGGKTSMEVLLMWLSIPGNPNRWIASQENLDTKKHISGEINALLQERGIYHRCNSDIRKKLTTMEKQVATAHRWLEESGLHFAFANGTAGRDIEATVKLLCPMYRKLAPLFIHPMSNVAGGTSNMTINVSKDSDDDSDEEGENEANSDGQKNSVERDTNKEEQQGIVTASINAKFDDGNEIAVVLDDAINRLNTPVTTIATEINGVPSGNATDKSDNDDGESDGADESDSEDEEKMEEDAVSGDGIEQEELVVQDDDEEGHDFDDDGGDGDGDGDYSDVDVDVDVGNETPYEDDGDEEVEDIGEESNDITRDEIESEESDNEEDNADENTDDDGQQRYDEERPSLTISEIISPKQLHTATLPSITPQRKTSDVSLNDIKAVILKGNSFVSNINSAIRPSQEEENERRKELFELERAKLQHAIDAKQELLRLERARLQCDLEIKQIQIVYEKAMARKKLQDAGVEQTEIDRILPL